MFEVCCVKKNEKDLKYGRKNHFEIEDTCRETNEIKSTYGDFVMKKFSFSKHNTYMVNTLNM